MNRKQTSNSVAATSIATSLLLAAPVLAQEEEPVLDEVVVTGRFISASQELVNERMNDAFATDLLGADQIARLGDSTVAAAQ